MQCEEYIRDFPLEVQPCWVGFSGGADSTALLLLLHNAGWGVHAVHFHHHLRGDDADDDAAWCREFCAARGIPFIQRDLDVLGAQERGESTESAARRLRLAAWNELCDAEKMPIFLAHHADDALEELFLRLGRGANLSGLVGMRPVRMIGRKLKLCRPLLRCRKSELEEYLRSEGVTDWRIDKTNGENFCRRNQIRNELMPMVRRIFGTDAAFFQSLRVTGYDAEFIDDAAARYDLHSLTDWQKMPAALLPRVLRRRFELELSPSGATIERIRQCIDNYTGGIVRVPLGGGKLLAISHAGVTLAAEQPNATHYMVTWRWREESKLELPNGVILYAQEADNPVGLESDASCEEFALDAMPDELIVRSWQECDAMQPFGLGGKHSSVKKLFNRARIYGDARMNYPIVCAGETIIWVVGVRRAEFGRCNATQPRVLMGMKRI